MNIRKITAKPAFGGFMLLVLILLFLLIGTIVYHYAEHLGWLNAAFFSEITATSVGYGNVTPHTTFGKIFTMFYIFGSIMFIFSFVNHFSRRTRKDNLFRRFFSAPDQKK